MAKAFSLKAETREHTGSKSAARVRKEGRIPAIVYGHQEEATAVSLDAHDFVEGLHHGHRVLDVQLGRKKEKVMVKDVQYDHLGKQVLHADLMRVDVTERVRVTVPIELKGVAKGTHEGGIINEQMDRVEVECVVTEIPESIAVNIKEVEVGDAIHARDIALPEGVTLVTEPETVILTCSLVAAAKTTEELEAEAPIAPEVIGEVKEEGEGAEES
jgi:large subunit ribosomal protein L25